MVPKGWSSVQAQDVCKSISVGVVIKPTQYYVPEGYGVKAFRSANVREGFINDSDWVYFSHEGHAINKKSHLKTGDVLIVRTGYPGTACVVTPEFEDSNAIDIVIARPDMDKIIPEYLCAYTNSHIGKSQVLDLQGGMAQKHLNVGAYQVLKINLPPLREQKKIAQILSTWDKAISVTEKLLTNSQQQKKALMQQLLTGKKRLLDENGERFSGEWKVVRLKQLLHEEKIRNKDNRVQRVLSVTNHSGFVLPEEQFSKRVASEDVSTYKIVKKNQYGYNPSRLNVGSFARLDTYDEGVLSPMYVVFSIYNERLNSDYFLNWMSSNEAKQRIAGSTQGSVRDSVGFDALCSFSFSLPALAEQKRIAAVLSAADAEISTLEKKLACLKDEKKALMQQLLTGKRRVSVPVKVEEKEAVSA